MISKTSSNLGASVSVLSSELINAFDDLWPKSGAESWDAPGLVIGSEGRRVSRVLLTVDVTSELVDEAIDGQFDLVLSHHPFLMRGVSSVAETTAKGSLITKAIRAGVDIFSAHTNADVVAQGVSASLAQALGVLEAKPLVPGDNASTGHGRIGRLAEPVSLGDFAREVARILPATAAGVKVAGDYSQKVSTIALCGGAGDSFLQAAIAAKADVYLSSDLRHHPVQDVREAALLNAGAPAIIDVAHWAGEWIWLETAAAQLSELFPSVQFAVSHLRTDPWDFVVTQ